MKKRKEFILNGDKHLGEYPILRLFDPEENESTDIADFESGELSVEKAWEIAEQLVYKKEIDEE